MRQRSHDVFRRPLDWNRAFYAGVCTDWPGCGSRERGKRKHAAPEPESRLVERHRGLTEIKYLHRLGLTGERLLLAHCLCVDDEDVEILRSTGTGVASCPLANLKLASGIAPLQRMHDARVQLSLGSDGAP